MEAHNPRPQQGAQEMSSIRVGLNFIGLLAAGPLVLGGCLAGLIAFLAVAHAMAPFFFMGGIGWFLWKVLGQTPRERERHQQALKEEQQRMDVLITTHLAAHRLMDTPQNRWHVLQLLSRPGSRRGRR